MLNGDGTIDTSYYGDTVPYLYHFDDGLGLFGINLGKIFGTVAGVVKTIASPVIRSLPGGGIVLDVASTLIPGGSNVVPNSGGRTADLINKDLADQGRYFNMAAAGDTSTRVESGMTAEQRLRWEASGANSGNPYEVANAQLLLTKLDESRRQRAPTRPASPAGPAPAPAPGAVPVPGLGPVAAKAASWILPAAIGGGIILLLSRR